MSTQNDIKQRNEADTPLLFFQCTLPSGDPRYWSSHAITFNGVAYSARVLKHNLFDLQLSADDAMDGISRLSLTLANADSRLSELNTVIGFKGSQLVVYFAFADLATGLITTESTILFRGIAGDPDEITEETLRLSFVNKLSLQRIALPDTRIQRLCPWPFPATAEQRAQAADQTNPFGRFARCGYSADIPGGLGNLNGSTPFISCDHTRGNCQERGMFDQDASGRITRRFGGFEFVPTATLVRTHGDKTSHESPIIDNAAKYNDAVPVVYGTGWLTAPVIFARNDGNLTHMEVLTGQGEIDQILKVVVNDVEIPQGLAGKDMTATGWWQIVTRGALQGAFNTDFVDANGKPLDDPHGSLSILAIFVPNRISDAKSVPHVNVLLNGLRLESFDATGQSLGPRFSNNPAWIILDILRRCGWTLADVDVGSFVSAAAFCQEAIWTTDINDKQISIPRYQCNLILTKRKSAAEIVRGIRVGASLMLRYGAGGFLELLPETSIDLQQPQLPDGSNATEPINSGWPAYEFSDAYSSFSGIVRLPNGASSVRLTSRSISETSNRLSVEFQDAASEYQQDSLSLIDAADSSLIGYEISSQSTALGLPNYSQATRVLLRQLDKLTDGNLYLQFQTSFRACKLRPGDLFALTYYKEGFNRKLFRVNKLSPSINFQTVSIFAQTHDDDWYSDDPAVLASAGRQASTQVKTPRPLLGPTFNSHGSTDFAVSETVQTLSDGTATDTISVNFVRPAQPGTAGVGLPVLASLSPTVDASGGALAGGLHYYYALTALDSAGGEGPLSFTVMAATAVTSETSAVTLTDLSLPRGATGFNVYRGTTPQLLYLIAASQILPADNTFTDRGLPPQPIGPPDSNFDHANFYYRYQLAGPIPITSATLTMVTNDDLNAVERAYVGKVCRITSADGAVQERLISSNSNTAITVTPSFTTVPAVGSTFVVAEAGWRFGAVSNTTPVQFEVPYRAGAVLQISGRAANVHNQECAADLCPLTTVALGGRNPDENIAGAPSFVLAAPGAGNVTVSQIGFNDLANTGSVTAATLQIFYLDELQLPSSFNLANALDAASTTVFLNQLATIDGKTAINQYDLLQIGGELLFVRALDSTTNSVTVIRGSFDSINSSAAIGAPVLVVKHKTVELSFAPGFFENRASQNYLHSIDLADVRIVAAQMFVTNAFGDSQTTSYRYDVPLRTLSGGQFSFQVGGSIAVQNDATAPLLTGVAHAVRDIRATLSQAATKAVLTSPGDFADNHSMKVRVLQNGTPYCDLVVPSGDQVSNIVPGDLLPPLQGEAKLSLNIIQVDPLAVSTGRDLTVTIRM